MLLVNSNSSAANTKNNEKAFENMQEGGNIIDTDTDDNQSETEDDVVIEHSSNKQTLEACAVR